MASKQHSFKLPKLINLYAVVDVAISLNVEVELVVAAVALNVDVALVVAVVLL